MKTQQEAAETGKKLYGYGYRNNDPRAIEWGRELGLWGEQGVAPRDPEVRKWAMGESSALDALLWAMGEPSALDALFC